jgi:methyltransferase (TIGR00027 family)
MAGNPAAQTAFGPMVQAAIEQYEPPDRRLVSDDLALSILPAGQRAMVRAMRWPLLRRLTISAGEQAVPGSWALIACRKRFIDDKLDEALGEGEINTVVVLGAGMDTRAYRIARRSDIRSSRSTFRSTSSARRPPCSARSERCPPRFTWWPWTLSATT